MVKFEITLAYNKERIIDTCNLEITCDGYHEVMTLNKAEVKQLLDLMKEAHSKLGKKYQGNPKTRESQEVGVL